MKSIRKRLTYANVMSSIAVFLVVAGGTAFAAVELGKESVGTKQLAKEAVSLAKIKKATKTALKGQAGPAGPAGSAGAKGATGEKGATGDKGSTGSTGPQGKEGPQGPQGIQGVPGLSELERVTDSVASSTTTPKTLTVTCAAGKKVVSTGFDIDGGSSGGKKEATIDEAEVNPDLESASFEAYTQVGAGTPSWKLTGTIVCAKVG